MKISTSYTVAIEILIVCEYYSDSKITSNFLSKKIGVDASTIRYILGDLKEVNFIDMKPGPGGIKLLKPLEEITLMQIYEAVIDENESIFRFPKMLDTNDQIEKNTREVLISHFKRIQFAMYEEMKTINLNTIYNEVSQKFK